MLAGHVLANEVELVNPITIARRNLHFHAHRILLTLSSSRNPMKRTVNDVQGCTAAKLGEEASTPLS
jgi:hypothetical protein